MLQLEGLGKTDTTGYSTSSGSSGSGAGGKSMTTSYSVTDCGALQATFAPLNAKLTADLAKAQTKIDAALAVQANYPRAQWALWGAADGQFFMGLARDALAVGDLAGKIDGCAVPVGSLSSLRALLKQNATDLITTSLRMNEAWAALDWAGWLKLVKKTQAYKRIVAKVSSWIVKAAATAAAVAQAQAQAAAAAAAQAAADRAVVEAARQSQANADAAAKAAADAAAAQNVEALIAAADAADAAKPAYRKPWFWAVVGGGLLVAGTAAVIVARRR